MTISNDEALIPALGIGGHTILRVSYMGTKRALSPTIKQMVDGCRSGPFLDAFAGMCSIGCSVGPTRQVWSNDLQVFSNTVARALFCSTEEPRISAPLLKELRGYFVSNMRALEDKYGRDEERERASLLARDQLALRDMFESMIEKATYPIGKTAGPSDLFTSRYGGVYFSIRQAMEIDSLRAAIDRAQLDQLVSDDQARWLLLATAIGMNRCTTSPGHFAQPVAPKQSNITRVARERSRSLLRETVRSFDALSPVGSKAWRAHNRVYSADATTLLQGLSRAAPAVVYADPPYTDDQYSRFYHLYETLILYDYPPCSGRGRYRGGRAVSDFSLASRVGDAVGALIKSAADLSADLILSYPKKGLLEKSTERIPELIREHYGRDPIIRSFAHTHSTMGGSKGLAASNVVECIYRIAA